MAAQQDGSTSNLKSLQIACTLTPGDLRERLGLIQALTAEALVGYDRDGLVLTLRYALEASSACARWSPASSTVARF